MFLQSYPLPGEINVYNISLVEARFLLFLLFLIANALKQFLNIPNLSLALLKIPKFFCFKTCV